MNINIPVVVTPLSIYHGCSTWEKFWAEKFTLGAFSPVNMNYFGRLYVSKHRDIKNSDK